MTDRKHPTGAPWRNFYLCGALELREGLPETGTAFQASEGMARGMPIENLFQTMAVRLNGPAADGVELAINLDFTDLDRRYLLAIEHSVLHYFPDRQADAPDAAETATRPAAQTLGTVCMLSGLRS